MTFILMLLPALVVAALIGFFGRKRLIGFWGFFALTIAAIVGERMLLGSVFSPIAIGLLLLLSAPGKQYQSEIEVRVAETFRRAGLRPLPVATSPLDRVERERRAAVRRVLLPPVVQRVWVPAVAWLVVVVVFAILNTIAGGVDDAVLDARTMTGAFRMTVPVDKAEANLKQLLGLFNITTTTPPAGTAATPAEAAGGGAKPTTFQIGVGGSSAEIHNALAQIVSQYSFTVRPQVTDLNFNQGLQLSLLAATFGYDYELSSRNAYLPWLMTLERLLVIGVLVLLLANLLGDRIAVERERGRADQLVTREAEPSKVIATASVVERAS